MSARRGAAYALVIAEALADARVELAPEEYDGLLEHVVGLVAESWVAWVVDTRERAA